MKIHHNESFPPKPYTYIKREFTCSYCTQVTIPLIDPKDYSIKKKTALGMSYLIVLLLIVVLQNHKHYRLFGKSLLMKTLYILIIKNGEIMKVLT